MCNKYENDLILGTTAEDEVFQILKAKYDDIQKTGSKYSIFDFQSKDNKVKVEVKSRRNVHNKYPTTMIGYNKIKKCNNPNTTYLFIFKFTDKIMYIKYDYEVFKGFDIKDGGRWDRKKYGEVASYLYIPIEFLTPIECL
jgi:hypothetical protein